MTEHLRLLADDGGALVLRTAAKDHRCDGDGSARHRHADACLHWIAKGEQYLEVLWEAAAYQSGNHVSGLCALEFYGEWVEPELAGREGR